MAEGARLESVYAGNRIEGSNFSPSANFYFSNVKKHQDHHHPDSFRYSLSLTFFNPTDDKQSRDKVGCFP